MNADKIIFIEDGKIIAQGKHNELYNNCNEYKDFVLTQISKKEALANG
jgi:ATP-binding cassette, subfamily B, multidrug efflux pump